MKKINYKLKNIEGIHIGTAYDQYEKGAVDSFTIKDKDGYPYIPATSIKGKVRFFLDNLDKFYSVEEDGISIDLMHKFNEAFSLEDEKTVTEQDSEEYAKTLFGSQEETANNFEFNAMKKVLFKDGRLIDKNPKQNYYEIKGENSIEIKEDDEGLKIEANPRIIERTIAGLEYRFTIILIGYTKEQEQVIEELLTEVMRLISEYGYIGGHGSRGYGQVEITKE